jgi:hypothetical protein
LSNTAHDKGGHLLSATGIIKLVILGHSHFVIGRTERQKECQKFSWDATEDFVDFVLINQLGN